MVEKPSKEHSINEPLIQRFMVATPLPTIRDQRTLTGWVTPATENNSPASAGLFIWKGCNMKKYYPVDFDDKGNAVLGTPKNTPTSNGFIPTTWAPGGSDEGKQGIKSITISPAITTTPALESLFPIYYDDLTEDQKQNGIVFDVNTDERSTDFVLTITPTSDWHFMDESGDESVRLENGEPVTISGNTEFETTFECYGDDDDVKIISVKIRFIAED